MEGDGEGWWRRLWRASEAAGRKCPALRRAGREVVVGERGGGKVGWGGDEAGGSGEW